MQNINKLFLLLILTLAGSSLWCAEQKSAGEQKAGVEVKVSNEEQDKLNERFIALAESEHDSFKEISELVGKVDINAQDADGNTALIGAMFWENEKIINILLLNAADPHIKNKARKTALMTARSKMAELLKRYTEYYDKHYAGIRDCSGIADVIIPIIILYSGVEGYREFVDSELKRQALEADRRLVAVHNYDMAQSCVIQ